VTYLVVLTLMAAVALIACTLPACLAASINPIATLHEE
jgi:ABC-type lipoprotein release transport system permease subunit